MTHDPFGLSFIMRELPKNCSRVKRKPIVDMNKSLGRNPPKRKKPPISQADYRPNYFFGKTNPSSRVGPLLRTLEPRKPDYYRKWATNTLDNLNKDVDPVKNYHTYHNDRRKYLFWPLTIIGSAHSTWEESSQGWLTTRALSQVFCRITLTAEVQLI